MGTTQYEIPYMTAVEWLQSAVNVTQSTKSYIEIPEKRAGVNRTSRLQFPDPGENE